MTRTAACLFVLFVVSACDGPASRMDDGSHTLGPSAGPGAGDLGVLDGARGAAPDAAVPVVPEPLTGHGDVFVYLSRASASSTEYASTTVGATFYEVVAPTSGTVCTTSTIGACVVSTCPAPTGASPTPPPEAGAGEVHITGAGESYTLETATNSHQTISTLALSWSGGDALSIASTGADVPAFMDVLTVPEQIVVTAPYLPAMGSVPIARSLGLTLKWQGGVHGEAVFTLSSSAGSGSTSAVCRYPASQTQAALPSSVLMAFPPGTAYFGASTESRRTQQVGTWEIASHASFNAIYDTGRTAGGQLQLD